MKPGEALPKSPAGWLLIEVDEAVTPAGSRGRLAGSARNRQGQRYEFSVYGGLSARVSDIFT